MDEQIIQSSAPFIGIMSQLIGWTFFLIALSMFKEFVSRGFSMAVGEFLVRSVPLEKAEKFTRWFANGDAIIESLDDLKEKLQPDDMLTRRA